MKEPCERALLCANEPRERDLLTRMRDAPNAFLRLLQQGYQLRPQGRPPAGHRQFFAGVSSAFFTLRCFFCFLYFKVFLLLVSSVFLLLSLLFLSFHIVFLQLEPLNPYNIRSLIKLSSSSSSSPSFSSSSSFSFSSSPLCCDNG